jgi:hypothetical protein
MPQERRRRGLRQGGEALEIETRSMWAELFNSREQQGLYLPVKGHPSGSIHRQNLPRKPQPLNAPFTTERTTGHLTVNHWSANCVLRIRGRGRWPAQHRSQALRVDGGK